MANKPPSKVRYDKLHPPFSFRITKDVHDELNLFLKKYNMSNADFVKECLSIQKVNHDQIYKTGYNKGYKKGYYIGYQDGHRDGHQKGVDDWTIIVPCWECKKDLYIKPNSKEHKRILKHTEGYLYHTECYPIFDRD